MNIQPKKTTTHSSQQTIDSANQNNVAGSASNNPIPVNTGNMVNSVSNLSGHGNSVTFTQGRKHPFFHSNSPWFNSYEGDFNLHAILCDFQQRVDKGEKFSFVIGRGNKEKTCEDNGTTWVYCDISGYAMNPQLQEKPHLWLDFDDEQHLQPVVDALRNKIDNIVFDYSVLKFFDHFTTDILPLLKDLLKQDGKLFIPDLEQLIGIDENPLPIEQQPVFGNLTITPSEYMSMAQPFFDDMLEKVGIELDNSLVSFYRQAKRKGETQQTYLEWAIEYLRNTGKFEEAILENAKQKSIRADRCTAEIYERWLEAKKTCLQKYFGQPFVEVRNDDQFPISPTGQATISTCRYFVASKALEA